MGYDYRISSFTGWFRIADIPLLVAELIHLRQDDGGLSPLEYFINYFRWLYDDNFLKQVLRLQEFEPPEETDSFPSFLEGHIIHFAISETQVYVYCSGQNWHGPALRRDLESELEILSKYCPPFKFLFQMEFNVTQYVCYDGNVVTRQLVEEMRDSGPIKADELAAL